MDTAGIAQQPPDAPYLPVRLVRQAAAWVGPPWLGGLSPEVMGLTTYTQQMDMLKARRPCVTTTARADHCADATCAPT